MKSHMKAALLGALTSLAVVSTVAVASNVTIPHTFASNTPVKAQEMNDNFNAVATANNDNHTQITTLSNSLVGSWQALTLTNGAAYGSGFASPAYYKDVLGWVHLKGLLKNVSGGQLITTLPSGYWPAERLVLGCQISASGAETAGRIDVSPNGNVTMVTPNSGALDYVSLDQISFKAM
jgi:hypothetical protein